MHRRLLPGRSGWRDSHHVVDLGLQNWIGRRWGFDKADYEAGSSEGTAAGQGTRRAVSQAACHHPPCAG
eukprot:2503641-Rhodomonas_salina.1